MARRALVANHYTVRARQGLSLLIPHVMKSFLLDETGLELSEYAIAAALVTLSVVGVFTSLGAAILARLNELIGHVNG